MYAELHCISNFSFLRGASHPEELVSQAAALGYSAIAITDECTMAGIVKAHVAAKEAGIKLIVGSEFQLEEQLNVVLLAANRTAYGQICNLITIARRRAEKGEYRLSTEDLDIATDQCLAIWIPGSPRQHHSDKHAAWGERLSKIFEHRLWLGLEVFPDGQSIGCYEHVFSLAKTLGLPMVAAGDVHMHDNDRKPLLDVISAVRMRQSIQLAGRLLFANREKYLRPISLLQQLYPPALLEASTHIAELCQFSLDELRYEYPEELVPPGLSSAEYLRQLTEAGAKKRWPGGMTPHVRALIEKELELIAEMEYEYYFLTVFDIVQFARSQHILCQGRGSAANSAVCYCLEITEVDPDRINVLFERFISKERDEPPDIDVDFEHERREEVIQYIYKKYGRHRAAIAATVVTYRPKSAIRDVGKALGLDMQLVEHLAKSLSWWDRREELVTRFAEAGVNPRSAVIDQFLTLVNAILGFPRHLSQHVGGFIISSGPLSHLVPVENASMPNRTIIQWDKNDLESLGLLKVDVLALGMLTSIRKSLDLINAYRGGDLTVSRIPPEDPLTYQMLQKGDSIGVFQVESRAQISMLPRLKPKSFYDLVIEVAIVRPGPIQGNMVHPYLKRRNGEEKVTYANDAVRSVLERTLGVPIFQEQVIKLAVVAAGFTPGEADQLRRAMAAWKRKGGLEHFRQKLVSGMLERGHDEDFANRIFEQIKGFGNYGFPESHAASFALLVYFSAWLKRHEPAAFYCGLLNSQPMGFYSPSQLVQDARRHEIEVRPVDINFSEWESTLEAPLYGGEIASKQPAVRLGFQRIKGFREDAAIRIVHARNRQSIANIRDIAKRARLDKGDLSRLTEGGAFKHLSGHRYQTHWQTSGILPSTPLLDGTTSLDTSLKNQPTSNASMNHQSFNVAEPQPKGSYQEETRIVLPAPEESDDLRADYISLGLTLGRHPMALLREQDREQDKEQDRGKNNSGGSFARCKTARQLTKLNHGRFVQVSGIVTGRQRPSSASGVLFLTLEDETDNINVVIWNRVLETFRSAVVQGRLLKIKGVLERQGSVIHVIAGHVEDLSHHLEHFSLKSRDFR